MVVDNKIIEADVKMMSCEITIGDPDAKNPHLITNAKYIHEVISISINDTYKTLINTANVKLSRATIFNSVVVKGVTEDGDKSSRVVAPTDNKDNIVFDVDSSGMIVQKQYIQSLVSDKTVRVGNRIRIKIGYNGELKTMFDGYVVKISTGKTIDLKCENMAYLFKIKQLPTISIPTENAYIQDICGKKYGFLDGTGIELHPDTKKERIQVGGMELMADLTLADLFNHWAKQKIYAVLKYDNRNNEGIPKILFVRPYSSANRPHNTNPFDYAYPIYFDYHVAKDNLTYNIDDPSFVAVQATGLGSKGKFFSVVCRKNPSFDPNNQSSNKYQFVNIKDTNRKKQKRRTGESTGGEQFLKSDLRTYNVIPYVSKKVGITMDELKKEAITWLETYQFNGIEGNVTIFGDYGLSSGVHVALIDKYNSDKNGIYIVDEVTTEFSVSGGYRQTLKIPYRVKKLNGEEIKQYD